MSNKFDEIFAAIEESKQTFRAADGAANAIAKILLGRLHHVSPWTLAKLKKELTQFNSHTKAWKP
jgi:hypothetical protein